MAAVRTETAEVKAELRQQVNATAQRMMTVVLRNQQAGSEYG
jgi:hypothetical protein